MSNCININTNNGLLKKTIKIPSATVSLPTKGNGDMIVHLWYTILVP